MRTDSRKCRLLFAASLLLCLSAAALSLCLGNINFTPAEIAAALFQPGGSVNVNIIKHVRIPRTAACLVAGAALAASGAVLQNVLANKLASPGIIGVNAGAGFGVTVCCAFGNLYGWAVSVSAFLGSLLTVLFIFAFARKTGASKTTVILSGVAINSILNACSESVRVLHPDVAVMTAEFRVGGFSAVSVERLLPASILILVALTLLFTLFNELDVLTLGDESAQSVGLPAQGFRLLFLVLAALLAGSAVSFAGLLGFIGLIVPHFVRKIAGNESRHLLPLSAVTGASFVTLCDLAARRLFMPYELPVGILMAVIGGPAFVWLLLKRRDSGTGPAKKNRKGRRKND